ncbi:CopG family transcriptional regulator [Corynebacterium capitovis]
MRLTQDEVEALDELARDRHVSRSELMRQAIAAFTAA